MEKIPFDLETFLAGMTAISTAGLEMTFNRFCSENAAYIYAYDQHGKEHGGYIEVIKLVWSMKPTSEDWIRHDGGSCPILWAKAGDFEVAFHEDCAFTDGMATPDSFNWKRHENSAITHFRLLNGWHLVKGDGTIPDAIKGAKAGEWEYRCRDNFQTIASENLSSRYEFKHRGGSTDIVAVRLVQKQSVPQIYFSEVQDPNSWDVAGKRELKDFYDQMAEAVAGIPKKRVAPNNLKQKETPQQSLTRLAYLRYKAAHPDPKPAPPAIGQDAIEGAIFAALCNLMRKKGK